MIIKPFEKPLFGNISVPGSKSITNRIFPLAVLSGSNLVIQNALESEDAELMRNVLVQLGVSILPGDVENTWNISSSHFFSSQKHEELFCGNSGTTIRFIAALAALRDAPTTLTGIERMKERPIRDLADALSQMGANIEYQEKLGYPPLTIFPSPLVRSTCSAFAGMRKSIKHITLSGKTSSQFFTALFHIAPYIGMEIEVTDLLVSKPYIDMTIRILKDFGITVENQQYQRFIIPQQSFSAPREYTVEADASSATYPLAIAALTGGSIQINHLPKNSLQGDAQFKTLVIDRMVISDSKIQKKLQPLGEINLEDIPDAAMTAVVLASCAVGYSKITGLSTLRHKECDRIFALESNLKKMGIRVESGPDYIEIWGDPDTIHGADIECFNDHRVAMCFGVLGTLVSGVNILDPDCTQKTYPGFWNDLEKWRSL